MTQGLSRRSLLGLGAAVVVCGAVAYVAKDALRPPEVRAPAAAAPAARTTLPRGPLPVR